MKLKGREHIWSVTQQWIKDVTKKEKQTSTEENALKEVLELVVLYKNIEREKGTFKYTVPIVFFTMGLLIAGSLAALAISPTLTNDHKILAIFFGFVVSVFILFFDLILIGKTFFSSG